ncbi:thioredoxin H9-like isoform X3 [Primulina huaijiensis]|uniref:thioredoxin H9-like isoform X3 n=1 Tax=Primulina eburnea TaxID=1245227 RepID=UPI003C6C4B11
MICICYVVQQATGFKFLHVCKSNYMTKRCLIEVIANFSASWCGPCRIIAPFYVELSEKHQSVMFLTVDVDELTEFSTSWDIKATPTFFFLKDGQQLDKLVGANKPELQKKVTAILDSKASCET